LAEAKFGWRQFFSNSKSKKGGEMGEIIRLLINIATVITIAIVVVITVRVIQKRKTLSQDMGVSVKTYIIIVGIVEVIYDAGLLMILSSMGVNVLQHLQNLEVGKLIKAIDSVDVSKMKFLGTLGWIGFSINCVVAFVAPAYLLIWGWKKLPKFIFVSAWLEIGLEMIVITLIFISLFLG
jgi:hypothetical protein